MSKTEQTEKKSKGQEMVDSLPEIVSFPSEKIIDYYLNGEHYYHESQGLMTLLVDLKAKEVYEEKFKGRYYSQLRKEDKAFWLSEARATLDPEIKKIWEELKKRREQELKDIAEMILEHQSVSVKIQPER